MKLSIKRTCNGCRAFEYHNECSLGFNTYQGKPKEACLKPRTYEDLIEASKQTRP